MKREDFGAGAHFGLGMWIRNNWGLWGESRLVFYFNSICIYHPDDMSTIILDAFWCRLHSEPFNLEEHIQESKNYWGQECKPPNIGSCTIYQPGLVYRIKVNFQTQLKMMKKRLLYRTHGGPMVYVPPGDFCMGCNPKIYAYCLRGEVPYHKVYLDGFFIDQFEVTQADYDECIQAGACARNERNLEKTDPRQPVVGATWEDALKYCSWAGKKLPTEAEWEKAARGSDGRIFPWGNQRATSELAVMEGGTVGCGGSERQNCEVGSKPQGASPYGAMDMAGNVWEWVQDWYSEEYYKESPPQNPPGPSGGDGRVIRGGGRGNNAWHLATFRRIGSENVGNSDLGFRCAMDE